MIGGSHGAVRIDDEFLDHMADRLAEHVAHRLRDASDDGYLDAAAAGRYMCVSRKRVHDLTSSGALVPDGRDGRKPLYRKSTLNAYVQGASRRG